MTEQVQENVIDAMSNDTDSSNEEMVEFFTNTLGLTEEEAAEWIAERDFYRLNIVLDDGSVYDPRKA